MRQPVDFSDRVAYFLTMTFRWFADTFFAERYGHRAVVLETVAGVPGMVAGMWQHLRSLRNMQPDDRGWIKTLLEEAENEREKVKDIWNICREEGNVLFVYWLQCDEFCRPGSKAPNRVSGILS